MDNLDTLGMWKKKQKKPRIYMCICQEVSDTSLALIILPKFLVWVTFCKSMFFYQDLYIILDKI